MYACMLYSTINILVFSANACCWCCALLISSSTCTCDHVGKRWGCVVDVRSRPMRLPTSTITFVELHLPYLMKSTVDDVWFAIHGIRNLLITKTIRGLPCHSYCCMLNRGSLDAFCFVRLLWVPRTPVEYQARHQQHASSAGVTQLLAFIYK